MELSTFAYTIGIIELLIGIPMLIKHEVAAKWVLKFLDDDVTSRVVYGILAILGGTVLFENSAITYTPEGFVVFIAWVVTIKGVVMAWAPHLVDMYKKQWLENYTLQLTAGSAATLLGIVLVALAAMVG